MELTANTSFGKLREYLFEPVSGASLGLFRIAWGMVMFYAFGRLCLWTGMGKHKYLDTIFHFKYPGFEWIEVLPPNMMYFVFYLGSLLSIFMILGLFYRFTSVALSILYIYLFLIDVTYWNNHYYAYCLVSLFFAVSDGHQAYSLDRWRLKLDGWIPRWQLTLFKFQFFIIYFYGGLSKLQNEDWMNNTSGYVLIENSFNARGWSTEPQFVYPISLMITYVGVAFDLLVGWLLLWRRTLLLSFLLILAFNSMNAIFWTIGSFPYTMFAAFILFLPPQSVHDFVRKISQKISSQWDWNQSKGLAPSAPHPIIRSLILSGLFIYMSFQILFPFRSLFYEGSVFWTKEGKVCGWHMMSGSSYITAKFELIELDPKTGFAKNSEMIDPSKFLNKKQIETLGKWPFLVPSFAKFLKKEAEFAGFEQVEIYGKIMVSRNKRPLVPIIDPEVELSQLERKPYGHNEWILRYSKEDGYFRKNNYE